MLKNKHPFHILVIGLGILVLVVIYLVFNFVQKSNKKNENEAVNYNKVTCTDVKNNEIKKTKEKYITISSIPVENNIISNFYNKDTSESDKNGGFIETHEIVNRQNKFNENFCNEDKFENDIDDDFLETYERVNRQNKLNENFCDEDKFENDIDDDFLETYERVNRQNKLIDNFLEINKTQNIDKLRCQFDNFIDHYENKDPGFFSDFKKQLNTKIENLNNNILDVKQFREIITEFVEEMKYKNYALYNKIGIERSGTDKDENFNLFLDKVEVDYNKQDRIPFDFQKQESITKKDFTYQPRIYTPLSSFTEPKEVSKHQENSDLHDCVTLHSLENADRKLNENDSKIISIAEKYTKNSELQILTNKNDDLVEQKINFAGLINDECDTLRKTTPINSDQLTIAKLSITKDVSNNNEKNVETLPIENKLELKKTFLNKFFQKKQSNDKEKAENIKKKEKEKKLAAKKKEELKKAKKEELKKKLKLYSCLCTNTEERYRLTPFFSCDLINFYADSRSKKKFITIKIRPDMFNKIIIDTCEDNIELIKLALMDQLTLTTCIYRDLYLEHLMHIIYNIHNHIVIKDKTVENQRKKLFFVFEKSITYILKKYKPFTYYSCFYRGKVYDIYVTFYFKRIYGVRRIKKYKKEKKYEKNECFKFAHIVERNLKFPKNSK
ncbi:hypothetical protein COBT_003286 [Conglomerata obtusa]